MASADEMAESVYQKYPRKVGRTDAIKAIHKAAKARMKAGDNERDAYAFLFRAVTAYAKSGEVASRDKKFIPYPASWFNAGHWEDDPTEWEVGKSENPTPQPRFGAWGVTP